MVETTPEKAGEGHLRCFFSSLSSPPWWLRLLRGALWPNGVQRLFNEVHTKGFHVTATTIYALRHFHNHNHFMWRWSNMIMILTIMLTPSHGCKQGAFMFEGNRVRGEGWWMGSLNFNLSEFCPPQLKILSPRLTILPPVERLMRS